MRILIVVLLYQGRRGVWNWTPLPLWPRIQIMATTIVAIMAITGTWSYSRSHFPSDPSMTTLGFDPQWMFLVAMLVIYNAQTVVALLTFQAIRAKARLNAV